MTVSILLGDCRERLRALPDQSVQTCVTSPPYFGLRSYDGGDAEIGQEPTPDEFVAALVEVFREVRRVLRDDGTAFINLGDSYAKATGEGLKPKDLIGIPWRVAFALQADGWYLRQDIIWSKPNPMPESVTDRCTKSHEYVFLLSKGPRYYFDAEAIREAAVGQNLHDLTGGRYDAPGQAAHTGSRAKPGKRARAQIAGPDKLHTGALGMSPDTRNKRSVWTVATQPFKDAHFATYPPALIEPCILAGSPPGGVVLDPFGGAGTTGLVAERLGRDSILIELNPEYAALAAERIRAANMGGAVEGIARPPPERGLDLFSAAAE